MAKQLPKVGRNRRLFGADRAAAGAELLRRYEAGKSIRELCADTGYSISRVRRLLDEAGVTYRHRGGGTRKSARGADVT